MRKVLAAAGVLAGLALWPTAAQASGDGGCSPAWTLESRHLGCAGRAVISPGNNTMINMVLLDDRLPVAESDLRESEGWWWGDDFGRTFFNWRMLVDGMYPVSQPEPSPDAESDVDSYWDEEDFSGSRCQSVRQGSEEFLAAVAESPAIGPRDRARLATGRTALLQQCERSSGWRWQYRDEQPEPARVPLFFASHEAREFGAYLGGASAFYAEDWQRAKSYFRALREARDPWLREAALYMEARTVLNEANAAGLNDWGDFERDKADGALAQRSERAFGEYLSAYPAGRYAASARGLVRRALWLGGETERQGALYAELLAETDPADPAYALLVQEIDNAFLFAPEASAHLRDPLLLATIDLLRMRNDLDEQGFDSSYYYYTPAITAEELAGQQEVFADEPELFGFLEANHAFYVTQDYSRVLRLLPDDARRSSYSNLQFSRQVLRGLALARLQDRNEAGFWRELLGGASSGYQRNAAELGLALAWERAGQVGRALAVGSPITNPRTREILIEFSAGPEVLRAVASGDGLTREERELAAFVLVYRELRHGDYAAALRDLPLTSRNGPASFYDSETYERHVPVGVFTRGRTSGGYACPALAETVDRLANNARDVRGRLCLGDFFRLNGFDDSYLDYQRSEGELGSHASYPGEAIPRSQFYADIIAERGVSREDRAYALYRAIRCYAPSGYSSCGGEQVPEEQRAAWFRRLKGEFGDTRWGQEAEYYW